MAEEPDNLALQPLRAMRAENAVRFDEIDALPKDVRLTVANHDFRFDAREEHVEAIREGVASTIGFAANTSRAHVDLRKQIADLTRRVEKLEAGR